MSNSHLPVKCHSVDMEKKEVKNTCNDVSVTFKVKKQQTSRLYQVIKKQQNVCSRFLKISKEVHLT